MTKNWGDLFLYSDPYTDDTLRFQAQVETVPKGADPVVFFQGSSQTREDIDSTALEEYIRARGYPSAVIRNLGVSGGWTLAPYLQLDLVLTKKPDIVFLMPYWRGFYEDFDATRVKDCIYSVKPLIFFRRLYGTDAFLSKYQPILLGCILSIYLPSYRLRLSLFDYFVRRFLRQEVRTAPSWFAWESGEFSEENQKLKMKKHIDDRLTIIRETPIQKAVFEDYVKRIKESGIELIILEAPWHPEITDLKDTYISVWNDYTAFIREVSRSFHVRYISLSEMPNFTNDDFVSFSYLNRRGRQKMTRFLEPIIVDISATKRMTG